VIPSKLLFVGDGPERSGVERQCRGIAAHADVRFVGKQEQMEDILAIADLFLLTSEYESFGLAALEAMASGVPVISTNAGGLPEINIDGYSGFLSDVGDIDSMSANAISILSDETTYKTFRENAFEQANKFDIKNIIPAYEEMYEKVLEEES
jgi:N-acetyl-alpha-D-glucosaminyl L-malate synthase BshA